MMIKDLLSTQMLPFTLLVLALQLYLVIWCIIEVIRYDRFNVDKKTFWIVAVIVFNFIGIIAFLIRTRSKHLDYNLDDMEDGLDENVRKTIFVMLLYTFIFLMAIYIYLNPGNLWIFLLLSTAVVIMVVLHAFFDKLSGVIKNILPYIFLLVIMISQYISVTENYGFIILIAIAAIIIKYSLNYSKIFICVIYAMFIIGSFLKMYITNTPIPEDYLVDFILMNTIIYMLFSGVFYFVKRQLVMNNYMEYLMRELKNKAQELEEASVLKERNRIAREIHDTLGHTLTGAIIQLELAKKLVYTSPEKTEESIQKTQSITRQGFAEVKRALKALRPIMIEDNTLEDGLKLLFERIKKDFNCKVKYEMNLPEAVSDELKISVYRFVQELITNSIRHGNANKMDIDIDYQFDTLRLNTKDNGTGCSLVKEGNGLRGIRERVEKLGGHVEFSSQVNEGFVTIIYIPI